MSKERYTVECLASGQPRPYADSRYIYRVTIEWQGVAGFKDKGEDTPYIVRPELNKECVMQILRGLTGGWMDNLGAFDRRLSRCEMVSPGVWEVVIIEPYCD